MKTTAICALGITLMALAIRERPDSADDFRSFYRAAHLIQSHESVFAHPSFCPDKHADGVFLPYIRIPSYAAALRPLASLPYTTARSIWLIATAIAMLGCVRLFPGRRDRLAIALAFSFPLAYTFVLGQDIAFVLLITLAAAYIFSKQREFLAGLVASLIAIKLSYLPAVGLVLFAKSRRATLGLAIGVAIQLAVSFALEGLNWPAEYLALLKHPVFDIEPRRMLNIRAIITSLGMPSAIYLIGGILIYALLWFAARRMTLPNALLIALPIGLIASPHCYVYDAVVLIPLMVTVASSTNWSCTLAIVALTPLPYLALMTEHASFLLAGSSLVVLSTLCAAFSLYARDLPIRITGSVKPFSSGTAISSSAS